MDEVAELILVRSQFGGELIIASSDNIEPLIKRYGTSPDEYVWEDLKNIPDKPGFYLWKGEIKRGVTLSGDFTWANWRDVKRLMPNAFS